MPDRTLSQVLADDHAALTRKFEEEPLTGAVMARIENRRRSKLIVLCAAAVTGTALATSQISALVPMRLIALGPEGPSATMLMGAFLIAATTAVLGWSLGQE